MFKKITSKDLKIVNEYLNVQPLFSLFFKADIQKYGLESDIFTMWGNFKDNKLNCLIGKFFTTLMLYSNDVKINSNEIVNFIDENKINFNVLIAKTVLAEQIEKLIPFSNIHKNYICELTRETFTPFKYDDIKIIKVDLQYLSKIIKLLNSIKEFDGLMNDEIIKELIQYGYTYAIIENNEVISLIMCSAKDENTANVGTVCTDLNHRNKGYASKLVSFLSNVLLNEDKVERCTLNYDNPEAGKIYNKIGFIEKGTTNLCIK